MPPGQAAQLLIWLAGPGLERPHVYLGLGEGAGCIFDHMPPAPGLGRQAIQHIGMGRCVAILDPKRQGGGPIGLVRPDRDANAQPVPAKGRGKPAQPLPRLAIKPGMGKILHHRADHVFFTDDNTFHAVLLRAGEFHLDAAKRATAQRNILGRKPVGIPDQPRKHA